MRHLNDRKNDLGENKSMNYWREISNDISDTIDKEINNQPRSDFNEFHDFVHQIFLISCRFD